MPEFSYIRHALPPERLAPIRQVLLESPFVSESTLGGTFLHSRGFAMEFKAQGRLEIESRFPALAPYFARVLGEAPVRALLPWWRRLRRQQQVLVPNCWYMNVLLVNEGGEVGPHFDTTLARQAGVPNAMPLVVSVLYLTVPSKRGGQLVLARDGQRRGSIQPHEGGLLHFRGDLLHEVLPFVGNGQRASLVIEQYHFEDEALARLPEFRLDSRAGFGAYLRHHEAREPKDFELE